MAFRHFYRNDAGTMVEITAIKTEGWSVKEASEEGSPASVQIVIPDPDMTLDFYGHRRWIVYEDSSEDANEVIFSGFVGSQVIGRKADEAEPTGRIWTLTLYDMNVLWDRRILRGSDTKRPEETDVERMEWLVATSEMGYIDDVSLIASGSTVTLDKRSVRGQFTKQVADECAQQAGKNYWLGATGTVAGGAEIFVWYGKDTLESYLSDLTLSNDPADWTDAALEDGTSTVWPVSDDSTVERSPDRVYDGAYVEYEDGAVYRRNAETTAFFTLSGRDLSHPAPEIKSKTRAIARANRLLRQSKTQLEVFRGSVELPAAKASKLRSGMRVPIKMTHVPDWEAGRLCRVLNAMPQPIAAGERYKITIEAEAVGTLGTSACTLIGVTTTESGSFDPLNGPTSRADGMLLYLRPGVGDPVVPQPSFAGAWNFPAYGAGGGTDFAGDFAQNSVRIFVAGPGTITIHTATYSGGTRYLDAELRHYDSVGGVQVVDDSVTGVATSSDITFTVPDDGYCYHWVNVADDGSLSGGKWGFSGYTWVAAE